jgi:APA family basic amino acid/polyamine antiporter
MYLPSLVYLWLRAKRPDSERPYKAFAYPILPIIYIILGLTFCFFLITMKPLYAGMGLELFLLGYPGLLYCSRQSKKSV